MARPSKRLLALLLVAGVTAGCAPDQAQSSAVSPPAALPQSVEESQSAENSQSGLPYEQFVSLKVDGLPFELQVLSAPTQSVGVVKAQSAKNSILGTDYEVLGWTETQGNMPGPMPRVLLEDGSAFGSLMHRVGDGDITSLEDIPSEAGIIATNGTFTPLSEFAKEMTSLPGSNPDELYFEPQHANAVGSWVVWREGSAGQANAMPNLDSDDWRMVAWNTSTEDVTELASAFLTHGDRFAPYASWDSAPTTDGTLAYFEATIPGDDGSWVNSVLSVPLDSPGDISLVGRGMMPVASLGGEPYWIATLDNDPGTVVKDGKPLFSVSGSGWSIRRLAGSEDLLIATVANETSAWLIIYDIAAGEITQVVDTGSDWAEASVSGSSFVWGNNSGSGDPTMYRMEAGESPVALWGVQGLSAPLISGDVLAVPTELDNGAIVWTFLRWLGN